jgi:NADH-quinone oxidoreductase subunit A
MVIEYLPIILALAVAMVFGIVFVWTSTLLGPQRPNPEKNSTYESGMKPVGPARQQISVKYYLVAMLFIIFDIEVIYVYPWAVEFRKMFGEVGMYAFIPMLIFLVVLELGYLYVYKKGGLKWD